MTEDVDLDNKQIASLAIDVYNKFVSKNEKIPGFGHRYHTTDPRAEKLIQMAIKEGFVGPHIKLAVAIKNFYIFSKRVIFFEIIISISIIN